MCVVRVDRRLFFFLFSPRGPQTVQFCSALADRGQFNLESALSLCLLLLAECCEALDCKDDCEHDQKDAEDSLCIGTPVCAAC